MSPRTAARDARQGSVGYAGDAGDSDGEKTSHFLVSGELFLRSTPQLFDKNIQKYPAAASKNSSSSTITTTTTTSVAQDLPQRRRSRAGAAATKARSRVPIIARDHHKVRHPSAGLLGGVSADLRDLLLCHPDPHGRSKHTTSSGVAKSNTTAELVTQTRRERRLARAEGMKQLKALKTVVACMAATQLNAAEKAVERFRRGCDECHAELNTRLGILVIR